MSEAIIQVRTPVVSDFDDISNLESQRRIIVVPSINLLSSEPLTGTLSIPSENKISQLSIKNSSRQRVIQTCRTNSAQIRRTCHPPSLLFITRSLVGRRFHYLKL